MSGQANRSFSLATCLLINDSMSADFAVPQRAIAGHSQHVVKFLTAKLPLSRNGWAAMRRATPMWLVLHNVGVKTFLSRCGSAIISCYEGRYNLAKVHVIYGVFLNLIISSTGM